MRNIFYRDKEDGTARVGGGRGGTLGLGLGGRRDGSDGCRCLESDDARAVCAPTAVEGFLDDDATQRLLKAAKSATFKSKDEAFATKDADYERLDVETRKYVREELWPRVDALMRKRCGFGEEDFITPYRVVVTEYSAGKAEFKRIERHADAGQMTFSVLLNDPREFQGGGTRFFGRVWHPENDTTTTLPENYALAPREAGTLVFHGGFVTHESVSVREGTRYLLIGFSAVNKECCASFDDRMDRLVFILVAAMFAAIFFCCDFNPGSSSSKSHTPGGVTNVTAVGSTALGPSVTNNQINLRPRRHRIKTRDASYD